VWQRHIEHQTSANEAVVAANDGRSKAAGHDFGELFGICYADRTSAAIDPIGLQEHCFFCPKKRKMKVFYVFVKNFDRGLDNLLL